MNRYHRVLCLMKFCFCFFDNNAKWNIYIKSTCRNFVSTQSKILRMLIRFSSKQANMHHEFFVSRPRYFYSSPWFKIATWKIRTIRLSRFHDFTTKWHSPAVTKMPDERDRCQERPCLRHSIVGSIEDSEKKDYDNLLSNRDFRLILRT